MRFARWVRGCFAVGLLGSVAAPSGVSASAVAFLDHFVITRSALPGGPGDPGSLGSYEGQGVFYADPFSDGAVPPSAGAFAFPVAPPSYSIFGAYGPLDESGGKLMLDSAKGGLTTNAAGDARRNQQSVLITSTDLSNPVAGLKQPFHTFAVYGLFDLAIPENARDSYQMFLRDEGPALARTEEFGVGLVRLPDDSLAIISFYQDFIGGTTTFLDTDPLFFPAGADQIEFRLQRATLGSDLITAAYRFWDGGLPVTSFVVMDNAAELFNNRLWVRAGFRAVEAVVPEPGTLALLFAALGVLTIGVGRRAH